MSEMRLGFSISCYFVTVELTRTPRKSENSIDSGEELFGIKTGGSVKLSSPVRENARQGLRIIY